VYFVIIFIQMCSVRDRTKVYTSLFLPSMSYKETKEFTASPPQINCNQTAIGLPTVTSAARGRLGGITEMPLLPLQGSRVSGIYVCLIKKSFIYVSIFLVRKASKTI
jgi:hypothetical protein